MQNTVISLPLASLTCHPALAIVPTLAQCIEQITEGHVDGRNEERLERLQTDWDAFVASIQAEGLHEPLKVVREAENYVIVDGRNRAAGALVAGLEHVPAIEVSTEEVDAIIVNSVIGRRHWTKSQKAWLGVKSNPTVIANSVGRPGNSYKIGISRQEVATKFGVSLPLVDQACELYKRCYANGKQSKAGVLIEPKIWLGASLGGLLAGAGALESAGAAKPGGTRNPSSLASVSTVFRSLGSRLRGFEQWPAEEQAGLVDEWQKTWEGLPEAVRTRLVEVVAR